VTTSRKSLGVTGYEVTMATGRKGAKAIKLLQ